MRYIKNCVKRLFLSVKNMDCQFYGVAPRNSSFEGGNYIGYDSEFDGEMGYASYIGHRCAISAKIGRYSCIGHNVQTLTATHPLSPFVSIHPAFFSLRKQPYISFCDEQRFEEYIYADKENEHAVIIGNDVWIGNNVLIKGGITIGDGAVIAAGAVVTSNVEPYSIVAGVPAKTMKMRFTEDEIVFLMKLCWWNKSIDWLRKYSHLFNDIKELRKELEQKNDDVVE